MYLQLIGLLKSAVELVASVDEQDDSYHGLDPECTETSGINFFRPTKFHFCLNYSTFYLSPTLNAITVVHVNNVTR